MQADRRERRRKKRQDEVSLDSVSTLSKTVEENEGRRRRKKMKKINETSTESEEKKQRKKKKKGPSGSVSSSEEGHHVTEKKVKKKREKKKLTGSQTHLLKEDFFSDRELATTLQGLEEDMYSVTGDGDTSTILSPYPPALLPPLPPSQPVAKIYTEKTGGFTKTRPEPPGAAPGHEEEVTTHQMSPLELGLTTQRVWRAGATFCHGLLAGLAAWQVRISSHRVNLSFIFETSEY